MKGLTVNRLKTSVLVPSVVVGALFGAAWVDTLDRPLALVIYQNRSWEYVLHEDFYVQPR